MGNFGAMQSKFIKNSILKTGDEIEFLSKGNWVDEDFSKERDGSEMKRVFRIDVSLNSGERKSMVINKTSGDNLSKVFGNEEQNSWQGKKVKVTFIKQLSFGKIGDVLVLEPIKE